MKVKKLFNTDLGKILFSIIIGLGLTGLFKKVCKSGSNDKSCIIYKGPSMKSVDSKVFKVKDKCYEYEKKILKCNKEKKIIDFAE
jgi:hypothetical protein